MILYQSSQFPELFYHLVLKKLLFHHESAEILWNIAWDKLERFGATESDFRRALVTLQPGKRQWSDNKFKYWHIQDTPITGILYKLMQGIIPKPDKGLTYSQYMHFRAFLDLTQCGLTVEDVKFKPRASKGEKRQKMMKIMMTKFKGKTRELLLGTGDMLLREKPSRGTGRSSDLWSEGVGGGENLCGECLMDVRYRLNILQNIPPQINQPIRRNLMHFTNSNYEIKTYKLKSLTLQEQSVFTRTSRDMQYNSKGKWSHTHAFEIIN